VRRLGFLARWLSFPRATWVALAVAVAVGTPSLFVGRFADDYLHLAEMKHMAPLGGPFDLYAFGDGNPAHIAPVVDRGPFPWWSLPTIRLRFFRPLSSALASFDVLVLNAPVPLQHVHSVLWYVALIAVLGALFKRTLPGLLGGVALIVFALDEAHFIPVAWLANRNALVATMPAFLALYLHLRWREDGTRWALPASLVCWALGLCGGETAIGVMGYVAAYEAFAAKDGLSRRVRALLPLGALFLGYVALYRLNGFGGYGSGIYLDPGSQPIAWLTQLPLRWLSLIGGALLNTPSELGALSVTPRFIAYGAGAVALVVFALLARRFWPALESEQRRHVRWLVAGAALSMLPLASTFPSNRLLLVPSVGGSVLIAAAICAAGRLAAGALGAVHLLLPIPVWALQFYVGYAAVEYGDRVTREAELDPALVSSQRVVVIGAPDPLAGCYLPLMRALNGQPAPYAWWALAVTPFDHRVTRRGPSTLVMETTEGQFLTSMPEQLFRGGDHPMVKGERVALDGMDITIEQTNDEGPTRLAFDFDRPLEDPSLQLMVFKDGVLRKHAPLAIGESEEIHVQSTLPLLR
jgi:hypothetical protein